MFLASHPVRTASLLFMSTLASLTSAQTTVAEETFSFGQVGTLLGGNGSGVGWLGTWDAGPNNDYALLAGPSFDPVGLRVHLNGAAVPCFRSLDTSLHPDLAEGGYYGRDGATVWLRFDAQDVTQSTSNPYFGGLSLFNDATEELFIGVPWGLQMWGLDTHGSGLYSIPGSNDNVRTTLVTRIDFANAGDRLRLWLNPAVAFPTAVADLDVTVPHFTFNRVRIDNSGSGTGANARFDIDAIRLEKPSAAIGTNYCSGNPNSTGAVAVLSASGSNSVVANNLVLRSSQMPLNAFGYFLTSLTQGLVPQPGGSRGVLCLGGSIGRYVGPGQIQNSGVAGAISLLLNLTQTPTPTGFVAIAVGETRNFQAWHRDSVGGVAVSNFTDGLQITFQ